MSSAARAERRRQERAAAKMPTARDGLRLVDQRSHDDCLRAAVATVLQIPYDDTPAASGSPQHFEAWAAWAAERGFALAHYFNFAPAFLDRWIATVLTPIPHAVVMQRGALLHNPDPVVGVEGAYGAYASSAAVVGTREFVRATGERTRQLIAEGSPDVWPLPAHLDPGLRRIYPPAPAGTFLLEETS